MAAGKDVVERLGPAGGFEKSRVNKHVLAVDAPLRPVFQPAQAFGQPPSTHHLQYTSFCCPPLIGHGLQRRAILVGYSCAEQTQTVDSLIRYCHRSLTLR